MNKTLVTFFTVLFCLTSSVGWSIEGKDLVEREGLYYKKFSDVPFTGKITGQAKGSFKNGKLDGSWVAYYDNGQLNFKGNYKNGRKDGSSFTYNKYGIVLKEYSGTFKNGKKISD
jgi:hypothetical protein